MKDDVIRKVALDIGNNTIKLLVGEMSSDFQRIAVTNYVKVKSNGISKSLIENPEALSVALKEAVNKAESVESPITRLSLALGGSGIHSATVNVKTSFPAEKEIEKADMDRVKKTYFFEPLEDSIEDFKKPNALIAGLKLQGFKEE